MPCEVDTLRRAGFSEDEIKAHVTPQTEALQQAGYSQEEIGKYLGIKPVDYAGAQKSLARRVYDNLAVTTKNTKDALVGIGETAVHIASGFGAGFPAYIAGGIGG